MGLDVYCDVSIQREESGSNWNDSWFQSLCALLKGLWCNVTVEGRRTFGVVFLIIEGRQLHIHCSGRAWSFSIKRILVTRINTA